MDRRKCRVFYGRQLRNIMRTTKDICNEIKINYKNPENNDNLDNYVGKIDKNKLLVKRTKYDEYLKQTINTIYVVINNLYIIAILKEKEQLDMLYKYLLNNEYSSILELSNMEGIIEFHIESL